MTRSTLLRKIKEAAVKPTPSSVTTPATVSLKRDEA
jgi:hypothetical protein